MAPSRDFQVIISSLSDAATSRVPGVREVTIYPDPVQGTALMEVYLHTDTWQAREAAIDKLVELRSMFIDDLSLEYRFASGS